MGPSRSTLLGANPEAVALRNLIAETNALPPQRPEDNEEYDSLYNPLWYRTKTQQQYDQDMRKVHFLERAKEMGLHRSGNSSISLPVLRHSEDDIRKLRSPREVYGEDWPIYNAARLFSSPPAMIYATGQMLANKVDPVANPYPNAADDYAKSMNNMLFFMDEPFGKNKNHMRDMQDMRDEMAAVPWDAGIRSPEMEDMYRASVRQAYAQKSNPKTGKEFLREAGVQRDIGDTATALAGAGMDFAIDPLMSPSNSVGGLLLDVGLGTAHETLPLGVEAIRYLRDKRPTTDIPYY